MVRVYRASLNDDAGKISGRPGNTATGADSGAAGGSLGMGIGAGCRVAATDRLAGIRDRPG